MAILTFDEEARIWNTLDPVQRERVLRGEITIEEAAKNTIPIGDLEMARYDAANPPSSRVSALDQPAPTIAPPSRERTWGDVWDINVLRLDQAAQGFGTEFDSRGVEYADEIDAARRTPILGNFTERLRRSVEDNAGLAAIPWVQMPLAVAEASYGTLVSEAGAALHSQEETDNIRRVANAALTENIRQMQDASAQLAAIPQSEYTYNYMQAMENGDYWQAAKNFPGAIGATMSEQALPLASAAAVTGTTYFFTRNPRATAAAARIAEAGMASTEYGSDLAELWEEVPEAERSYEKFKEIQEVARQSAGARALIEAALPGYGARLGKTAMRRAQAELILQMGAGAFGEDVAQRIKSGTGDGLFDRLSTGEGASAGELLLEAGADSAGVVVTGGPSLRQAGVRDRLDAAAEVRVQDAKDEAFRQSLAELELQKQADANRAAFDAEAEAEAEARRLANQEFFDGATQAEMPIGSGEIGGIRGINTDGSEVASPEGTRLDGRTSIERDRVPTIVDMFSGESRAAPNVQARLDAGVPAAETFERMPEETDEAFEIRKQRELDARRQIAERNDPEAQRRRQEAEDVTILKNEKRLLSAGDIKAEAENLLASEVAGMLAQKRGLATTPERRAALEESYRRQRLPQLISIVRKRRNEQVVAARRRDIDRENEKLRLEKAEQAQRDFVGAPRDNANGIPARGLGLRDDVTNMTDLLPAAQQPADSPMNQRLAEEASSAADAQRAFVGAPRNNAAGVPRRGMGLEDGVTDMTDLLPRDGEQGTLDLQESAPADLFDANNNPSGYTGTMTDEQRVAEAQALGQRRASNLTQRRAEADARRAAEEQAAKEQAEQADREARELEESLQGEMVLAEQLLGERAGLTQKNYAAREKKAMAKIVKEYAEANPDADRATAVREIAAQMRAWKEENPAPAGLTAVAPDAPLVKEARAVANKQASKEKSKENSKVRRELEREIRQGATPEEAAAAVSNRILSPEEDANVRSSLRRGRRSSGPVKMPAPSERTVPYVQEAIEKELASSRPRLSNVLNAIAAHNTTPAPYKWLARKLAPLVDNLGVNLREYQYGDDAEAVYVRETNSVQINRAYPMSVLHESLHAVTVNLIESKIANNNPRVKRAVAILNDVLAAMRSARDAGEVRLTKDANYGLTDVLELVSVGLTDRSLVEALETVRMPGQRVKTAFDGFKDALASIFAPRNPEQRSALDAVIEATGILAEVAESNPMLFSQATAEARRRSGLGFTPAPVPMRSDSDGPIDRTRRNLLLGALAGTVLTGVGVDVAKSSGNVTVGRASTEFDKAFNTPLSEEVLDILRAGNGVDSVKDALRSLRGKVPDAIASLAEQTADMLPPTGVSVRVIPGKWNAFGSVRIDVNKDVPLEFSIFPDTGADIGTLIHEAQHVIIAARYNTLSTALPASNWDLIGIPNPSPDALAKFREVYYEFREWTRKPDVAKAISGLDELGKIAFEESYRSPDEFFVRTLTDPSLRAFMADKRYDGRTLIEKFKDWVKTSLFGFREEGTHPSWLDAALEVTQNLSDAARSVPPDLAAARAMRAASTENSVAPSDTFSNPTTKRSFATVTVRDRDILKLDPKRYNSFGALVGTVTDWLSGGMGASARTTEILERAKTSAAAVVGRAENLYRSIDVNLNRQATAKNVAPNVYRDEFIKKVTAFEEETTPRRKLAMGRAIRKEYGHAGRDYLAMRRAIDGFSKGILNDRLSDDRPFTEAEASIYQSIRDNLGRYYTRVYASNTKQLAEQRANRLLKAYDKVAKGSTDKDLMDEYEIVRNAIEFTRDELLYIPEAADLESMPMDKLTRLADAWGVVPQGEVDLDNPMLTEDRRASLVEALEAFADATPQAKEQRARAIVEHMLTGRTDSALVNYYRGARRDKTIVTERENVPPPIRKLLGEFEDPFIRGMLTMVRQSAFRAHIKAINELIQAEQGTRILTNQEFLEQQLSPRDWRQLRGESYGPLEGLWVREDLALKLESTVEISTSFQQALARAEESPTGVLGHLAEQGWRKWTGLASVLKSWNLVWNPANAGLNYLGGFGILTSNGNFSLDTVKRAHATAIKLVQTSRAEGRTDPEIDRIIRAGVTDSAIMGEVRAVELDQLRQVTLDPLLKSWEKKGASAYRRTVSLRRGWREIYAMADVVWKIANFYAEEAKLKKLNELESTGLTSEQIEREAARRTNVSNFSYRRVPNTIKALERGGITYILPYIYETFRAPIGSFVLGVMDIRKAGQAGTPEGRNLLLQSGFKRAIGAVMSMGVMQSLVYTTLRALAGEDEDDAEWVEALKAVLPDFKRLGEYINLGRDPQGRPTLLEISRIDPMGPATELYKLMLSEDADAGDVAQQVWDLVIANPYGSTLIQAAFGTGPAGNSRLERISPGAFDALVSQFDDPSDGEKAAKIVDHLLGSWVTRALDPNNAAPEDTEWYLYKWLGGQLVKADPEVAAKFTAGAFVLERRDIRNDFKAFLQRGVQSDAEIVEEYLRLQKREAESFQKLDDLYVGLLRLDYPPETALAMLKQWNITDADLSLLASGMYGTGTGGVISYGGLEQAWADASAQPTAQWSDAKKERYYNNLVRTVRLIDEGRLPARE